MAQSVMVTDSMWSGPSAFRVAHERTAGFGLLLMGTVSSLFHFSRSASDVTLNAP